MPDLTKNAGSTGPTLEGTEWSVSLPGQVLSIVEIPLLFLAAYGFVAATGATYGPVVQPYPGSQTYVDSGVPGYLATWLVAATIGVLVALVVIAVALFQRLPARKIRLLTMGNLVAAGAAGIGVAGATFLHAVWTWSIVSATPATSYPVLGGSGTGPTGTQVVEQLFLSLAAGAGAALLPSLVVFIMYRTQRIAADR